MSHSEPPEPTASQRVTREWTQLEHGRAQIEQGLGISETDLEAWLDRLDQDPDAPLPGPGTDR